jgi:hypothetical protein
MGDDVGVGALLVVRDDADTRFEDGTGVAVGTAVTTTT